MTDSFVAKSGFYTGPLNAASSLNNNALNASPASSASPIVGEESAAQPTSFAPEPIFPAPASESPKFDMKESIEWLLGSEDDSHLPHDEKEARRERRFDLMLWLLNLEPRLGHYGDPQPG